ncbi:hypothetical protein LEMLEM_LOCUS10388, partial [Lemmus lemmus]
MPCSRGPEPEYEDWLCAWKRSRLHLPCCLTLPQLGIFSSSPAQVRGLLASRFPSPTPAPINHQPFSHLNPLFRLSNPVELTKTSFPRHYPPWH